MRWSHLAHFLCALMRSHFAPRRHFGAVYARHTLSYGESEQRWWERKQQEQQSQGWKVTTTWFLPAAWRRLSCVNQTFCFPVKDHGSDAHWQLHQLNPLPLPTSAPPNVQPVDRRLAGVGFGGCLGCWNLLVVGREEQDCCFPPLVSKRLGPLMRRDWGPCWWLPNMHQESSCCPWARALSTQSCTALLSLLPIPPNTSPCYKLPGLRLNNRWRVAVNWVRECRWCASEGGMRDTKKELIYCKYGNCSLDCTLSRS